MEKQAKDGTVYKQVGENSWEVVTREAKDGTVFKKMGSDSWAPMSEMKPQVSKVGTAVRQGLQGATGGFSDEIAGGVEAAGKMIGVKGLGGPFKDIKLDEEGASFSSEDLKKAYEYGRNKEREALKLDSEANPMTSLAANVAGGIASPINKVTKGMSAVKSGALLGGVYGLGSSDADNALDLALDTGMGAAVGYGLGKGADKLAKSIAPAAENIASKISPAVVKKNQNEIIAAADRLGIKVTPGMLDDTEFVQRLEYTLANSPSFLGQRVKRVQDQVVDKLRNSTSEVTKDATNLTNYQVGDKFKSGVSSKVAERLDPISSVFDEVAQSTKSIPVSQKSKDAIINNIQKIDEYSLTGGAGKPGQYVEMIGRLQNADQVKTAMTLLNKDIKAAQGAEKQVLIGIKNKLSKLEENSIMRAAVQQSREAGMRESTGKNIGSSIVGDLKDARSAYRQLLGDMGDVAESARIKTSKGPTAFLDAIESIPNERIQEKFFNTENFRQLSSLKDKFPEQFNLLRQGKLKDLADTAVDNTVNGQGKVSTQKFLNEVRKLSPEAKQMILGDASKLVDDIQTLQSSIPKNFNPSGSGTQAGWKELLASNIADIGKFTLYKGASSNIGKKVANGASELLDSPVTKSARDVTSSAVAKLNAPISRLSSAESVTKKNYVASDDEPTKGTQKWVNDGAAKLEQSGLDSKEIEQLKKSKPGRELLIEASDAKPNSKRMDSVLKRIRTGEFKEAN